MPEPLPRVDIVGVGLNATDTIIRLPHFPSFNSKVEFRNSEVLLGGQVASAVIACAKWGLKTRYIGRIGDDTYALMQRNSLACVGAEAHWIVTPDCQSQSSFILVDERSGERTVLWKRDPRLELLPSDLQREWVVNARLLHVDGHDCSAATAASRWAREAGIPVTADLDNLYPGVEALLENVDYVISSREFPGRLTGEQDLLSSLPRIARRFGNRLVAATLGADGVLAWDGSGFLYSPAFDIKPIDTTGAGDIFHGAFAFSLLRGDSLRQTLEFGCAAGGLACTGYGAQGGIATLEKIQELIRTGLRRAPVFSPEQLDGARAAK